MFSFKLSRMSRMVLLGMDQGEFSMVTHSVFLVNSSNKLTSSFPFPFN